MIMNNKGDCFMDKFFRLVEPKNDWEPFIYCDADFSYHKIFSFFDSHYVDLPSFGNLSESLGLNINVTEDDTLTEKECVEDGVRHHMDELSPHMEDAISSFIKEAGNNVLDFNFQQYFVCRSRSWLEKHRSDTSTEFFRKILNSYKDGYYDGTEKAFRQRCKRILLSAYKHLLYSDYLSKEEIANMNFVLENAFLPGFIYILKKAKNSYKFFDLLTLYVRKNRGKLSLDELESINNLKLIVVLLNNIGYQKFYPPIEPVETTVDITDPMQAKEICEDVLRDYGKQVFDYVDELNANSAKALELFKKYFDDTSKKLERYVYNRSYGLFTSSSPDYFGMLVHLYAMRVAVDNYDTKYSRRYKKHYLRD